MSLSTATVVSPISRTKEGFLCMRRIGLPGTIPRELSFSRRFLDFGVMKTIRTSSLRTASARRVTSGLISVRILSQHSPRGIGLPWGQTGGCPRNVQTLSVTVFVRMCSNLQAVLSTWLLSRSNRLLRDHPRALFPRFGEPDLIVRRFQKACDGELFKKLLRMLLLRPPEDLRPSCPPLLPESPYKLENFVLAVFGHVRDPFENRDRTKFTTFDSGTGNE
jgi:hypothetical protein